MLTGEQVKKIRDRLGENQAAFASRLGVDQGTVCRWERGGVPDRTVAAVHAIEKLRELDAANEAPQ